MNRHDVILAVSKVLPNRKDAVKAVEAAFDSMRGAINRGEKVVISNFGTFRVKQRSPRQGRNPKTGASVNVGARKGVRFKASKHIFE
jgi:nucleoid DNA-binding protein